MADPNTVTTTVGLGGGSPVTVGGSSTSLVGFYGATPIVRPAAVTTVTTTAASSTTPYGYTTSTQADAIVTAVNAIISRLGASNLGLTA